MLVAVVNREGGALLPNLSPFHMYRYQITYSHEISTISRGCCFSLPPLFLILNTDGNESKLPTVPCLLPNSHGTSLELWLKDYHTVPDVPKKTHPNPLSLPACSTV